MLGRVLRLRSQRAAAIKASRGDSLESRTTRSPLQSVSIASASRVSPEVVSRPLQPVQGTLARRVRSSLTDLAASSETTATE